MSVQNPFDNPLRRLSQAIQEAWPIMVQKMGTIAVNFVHENFEKEGFQGPVFEKWAPRKKETRKSTGKPVLTDTAHLRNSTRYEVIANDAVKLFNMMPYAATHNYGQTVQHPERTAIMSFARARGGGLRLGRIQTPNQRKKIVAQAKANIPAHSVKYAVRKFIGDSPVLDNRIETMMVQEINTQLKR